MKSRMPVRQLLGATVIAGAIGGVAFIAGRGPVEAQAVPWRFHLIEATIGDVHRAIRERQITCRGLIEAYVNRAKAYNGVAHQLVTLDGASIPPAPGVARAGSPLKFPTDTIKASTILPHLDEYTGPPIDWGRMEPTASDPSVQQQFGMIVGIPKARQLAALATINLRGERSVTCKGDLDKAPKDGPLAAGAPPVCEELRKQPDALERASELDAQYGSNPDLAAMPMYCIAFTFKDSFDTKDMRTTGGGDARYDIDVPPRDFTLVEQLRAKGAIIYAKSVPDEYNARAGNPGGPNRAKTVMPGNTGYQRSTWGGNPANPYDTTRAAAIGSSSGSAVSVTANLAMCSLCEETNASCRGPSNHNGQAMILPAKGLLSYFGGAIGNDMHNDRSGIECRTIGDAAQVWDALKDPKNGYYDPRDVFTTVRRSSFIEKPYATHTAESGAPGSLKGMRIGVIRESMLVFPGTRADEPIVEAAAKEIKEVLGAKLGATLVESIDPLWKDDPAIENMSTSYTRALTKLLPVFFPDVLFRLDDDGTPEFPDVAAHVKPTVFERGIVRGTGTMAPVDYLVALAEGRIAPPPNLNIRSIQQKPQATTFHFHFRQYATRRAEEWKARGFTETLVDFTQLNARSKFWGETQREAFKNWELFDQIRFPLGERQSTNERAKLRELLSRLDIMVMRENHLDALVRLHTSLPPGRTGYPGVGGGGDINRGDSAMGPNAGLTEVQVPGGFVTTVYDPVFTLSPDKKRYVGSVPATPTTLPAPGLPFALVFRTDVGSENVILKIASAYEAASKRRVPPPDFGPLPGEP